MRIVTAHAVLAGVRAEWRRVLPLLATLAVVPLWPIAARADEGATWRFEPAFAPSPPAGISPAPYPVPVGSVGQLSFWAPNRGLLITGGTQVVPAGLYAYDGVSWHELSRECGSAKGRIAWAGPDEFWTISDQRAGQITGRPNLALEALSLCHFINDEVVGSYAMPLGEPDSYLEMDAAACLSANDCWFAGQDGQSPNVGSFHLHWDGSEMTAIYDSSDHAVTGMTSFDGKLYEGLAIDAHDSYLPTEEPKHPAVIRSIAAAGQTLLCGGTLSSFCDISLFSDQPLPVYPEKTLPDALGGFQLATDGAPLGSSATQLWAGADPLSGRPPAGSGPAALTILRNTKGSWTQILPTPSGNSLLGGTLSGSSSDVSEARRGEPGSDAIAPEPGTNSAWLSLEDGGADATVALLEAKAPQRQGEAGGAVVEIDQLPGPQDPVGFRGHAGPIACPAKNDCWMVTNEGWLFHLTDGTPSVPDTDPLFDGEDGVIAYRPPDDGIPAIYPDGFAEDDSLANQQPAQPLTATPEQPARSRPKTKKAKPLVEDVKSRFLHHRTLVISFTLTARAHVQLIGRQKRNVVASTPRESLRPGTHKLSLRLNPAKWPTKLQFVAKPIGHSAPATGTEDSNSADTVGT